MEGLRSRRDTLFGRSAHRPFWRLRQRNTLLGTERKIMLPRMSAHAWSPRLFIKLASANVLGYRYLDVRLPGHLRSQLGVFWD